MSRTPDHKDGAAARPGRPDALAAGAAHIHGLADLLKAGLTVLWQDELAALQRDREALAALRAENFNLRMDVIFLKAELRQCRKRLELYRVF